MISALLLYLIDVRSLFISAGAGPLRQATLAFTAAVLLWHQLIRTEGMQKAKPYSWAIGGAIALFAGWHASKFITPIPMSVVFFT